ncbi:hypothetical protein VIBNISFn27_180013 [Vibrio nigripulchritudo SFn27]|uniref:Uncharacterized protein n=1 Tax=Vibrio nigripulchritudo TaxID=28173 RepID=U4KCY2_9VIBR|nr:hypothetical protein VIBNIBLFn1_110031 [Vibrio nigripulchritudo BLFn1]CCN87836.1 hypothetical protein VIBNISFn27_180013 [Vibrio nigripulchritudo SFn27]CCN93735.1 hypothetical protein VIBNIENn2_300031 [Vibrio nigripulchritudo ENn2]CCO43106.1 hypothetical protein VIBNISFn135_920031 [Vibrio nigripulchritudo SFn135]CCO52519.1 hypothetical protein VIBNIWn13_340013 [Vibrio nigripulchritudo Wn13]CCO60763.1 hypothetical protein VIBNI_B0983 [Vibrio nigripulchritudo]
MYIERPRLHSNLFPGKIKVINLVIQITLPIYVNYPLKSTTKFLESAFIKNRVSISSLLIYGYYLRNKLFLVIKLLANKNKL